MVGSYTYSWDFRDYLGSWFYVGSGQTYDTYVTQSDEPYFDLRVTVSSGGDQASDTHRVNVDIGGGCNPFCE